ncbi:hypothetical protein [Virgibacillus sp. SK37]|uniref:hypothetical protein n=1 Tax=Virgibacillus sp. SK37 TaxID=403957 RepID=UPI0004D0D884|nr:hypothetical protein [Virgibacillus sp. SK37]AIF45414.1 hypothetical protein X953_10045 [Virgibacillus sp. SK37]
MTEVKCYGCNEDTFSFLVSEYELKSGGKVNVCIECENNAEVYFDKIKRNCLIDGKAYELTENDRKQIRLERKLRLEKEEDERILDCKKSIFYFSNVPLKKPEYNHQALKYINEFVGADDSNEDHIQRFKFNYAIGKHWHLEEWDGLTNVHIYIDEVSKEYQKVKKPEETKWRDRTRKWYSGRFECDESFYNVTFGFSQYDNEPCGDVYVSYDFICSKSYKISRLVKKLLIEDGWEVRTDET